MNYDSRLRHLGKSVRISSDWLKFILRNINESKLIFNFKDTSFKDLHRQLKQLKMAKFRPATKCLASKQHASGQETRLNWQRDMTKLGV